MSDPCRVIAGECTVREHDGTGTAREARGRVVVLGKPDGTVLVHDAEGYQPVAWLTRADGVAWERVDGGESTDDEPALSLTARKDQHVLRVTAHDEAAFLTYEATAAGQPVGTCPCGGTFVRADGRVRCLDCGEEYGLPRDATVLDDRCDCGRPEIAVERGRRFRLCLARDCEHSRSLDAAVREVLDGEWDCPGCGAALRVMRRGGLMLGCERYPDCETGFVLPTGTVDGRCECGLPVFERDGERRCVDAACERAPVEDATGEAA